MSTTAHGVHSPWLVCFNENGLQNRAKEYGIAPLHALEQRLCDVRCTSRNDGC